MLELERLLAIQLTICILILNLYYEKIHRILYCMLEPMIVLLNLPKKLCPNSYNCKLPNRNVYISLPTLQTDYLNAAHTVPPLSTMLKELKIQVMNNDNITAERLGKKGVHLIKWGISKLAMNINLINQL